MWGGGGAFMENASPGVHRRFTALENEVSTLKQKLQQKVRVHTYTLSIPPPVSHPPLPNIVSVPTNTRLEDDHVRVVELLHRHKRSYGFALDPNPCEWP